MVSKDMFFQPDKCTTSNQCGVGEGDCDSDEECTAGLKCGSNNCFTDEGPGSEISSAADCCYDPPTSTTTTTTTTTSTSTVRGCRIFQTGTFQYDIACYGIQDQGYKIRKILA